MNTKFKSTLYMTQSLAAENRMRGSKPTLGGGGFREALDEAQWQGSARAVSEVLNQE